MRVLFAGDTHGNVPFCRYLAKQAARLVGADRVLQVGDFGFWEHEKNGVKFRDLVSEAATRTGVPLIDRAEAARADISAWPAVAPPFPGWTGRRDRPVRAGQGVSESDRLHAPRDRDRHPGLRPSEASPRIPQARRGARSPSAGGASGRRRESGSPSSRPWCACRGSPRCVAARGERILEGDSATPITMGIVVTLSRELVGGRRCRSEWPHQIVEVLAAYAQAPLAAQVRRQVACGDQSADRLDRRGDVDGGLLEGHPAGLGAGRLRVGRGHVIHRPG